MTTAKFRFRPLLAILGVASLTMLVAGPAYSNVQPGMAGHGWPNSSLGCFQGSNAAAFNFCTGTNTQLFIIPFLATTTNNNHTYRARVRGNGSINTDCRAFVVDSNNGAITTLFSGTNSTSFQLITMGTLFLPTTSTGHIECNVAPSITGGADGGAVLSAGEP